MQERKKKVFKISLKSQARDVGRICSYTPQFEQHTLTKLLSMLALLLLTFTTSALRSTSHGSLH